MPPDGRGLWGGGRGGEGGGRIGWRRPAFGLSLMLKKENVAYKIISKGEYLLTRCLASSRFSAPSPLPLKTPSRSATEGVQPDVVQEHQRDRQHARLLPEPDHRLAIPQHDQGHHAHRTHHEVGTAVFCVFCCECMCVRAEMIPCIECQLSCFTK